MPRIGGSRAEGVDPGLIFDIGMDQCQDTDFYIKKGFRVVAVDANPSSCAAALDRYAAEVARGQLVVVNRAVSRDQAPLTFYVCETESAWSTASPVLREWGIKQGAAFTEVKVEGVTAVELIEQFGVPYFCKVDIEGYDLVFLDGLAECAVVPRYLSCEVEFRRREYADQLRLLERLGYQRFALVSQKDAPFQRPPRPAREGHDIDYTFAHHASGLFGEELPSAWRHAADVRRECTSLAVQYKVSGALQKIGLDGLRTSLLPRTGDWFDIHAAH